MSTMSRSARLRHNRRAGITRPAAQPRPDLRAADVAGIRNVGYQPGSGIHGKNRVRYSGSGDQGYGSDWSRPANLPYSISRVTCDRRWDR